jgi:uncharacterized protein involved in outer membrane biogenesis
MPTIIRPRRDLPLGRTIAATTAVLLLTLVLLWDWNWFKPLVEARATAALNRKVTIAHLGVKLGARPWLILDDPVIANPPEMTEGTLASIGQLSIHLDPWPLLKGKVVLPDIVVDRLRGDLRPAPSGKGNWVLDLPLSDASAPPRRVEIGSLSIIDGSTHMLDPERGADFAVLLHTENADSGDEARVVVTAEGVYAAQKVSAKLVGGALLGLRDPADPYKIAFTAANGATKIALTGTLLDPLRFGGATIGLVLQGDDLSDLFPLTGIPLPPTPAYKLEGGFDYKDRKFHFSDFSGTVGSSDLRGDLYYESHTPRPEIAANLISRKVVLADLAGFIGAAPGKPDAPSETAKQQRAHDRQDAKASVLPDQPINLPKLRSADLHVSYKAERIETDSTPLDNIEAVLDIVEGKLSLRPLSFGVGKGQIVMNLALDGQQDQVHVVADVDFRKLDLSHIMSRTSIFHGAGEIGGTARIDSTGNSMKSLLGRGDGDLKLFMTGGDISALMLDLAGIDLGNAVLSALGIPSRATLRCMVGDFGLKDGQVETRTLLIDTTEANVVGSGAIDLKNEKIDYRLKTEPKHFNIGSLPAPILIRGDLKSPNVAPDAKALALRGGAAVVLGVLLTPLGALIPTIQLGLGEDNDCVTMLKTVGAPPATAVIGQKRKGK